MAKLGARKLATQSLTIQVRGRTAPDPEMEPGEHRRLQWYSSMWSKRSRVHLSIQICSKEEAVTEIGTCVCRQHGE